MKKILKRIFFGLAVFMIFTITAPVTVTYAKTPTKLSSKDFSYTVDGEKKNFQKEFADLWGENSENWYYNFYSRHDDIKTYRGIKIGSTSSAVQKKYGKTIKKKYSVKDMIHKQLEYNNHKFNMTVFRSYLDYSYKSKGIQHTLRFYLNNKNKVVSIGYIRNLSKIDDVQSKSVNTKVSFKAPKGEKITTVKMDGKKVSILPKGTKILIGGKDIEWTFFDIYQMNNKGDVVAECTVYTKNANGKKLYSQMEGHMYKLDLKTGGRIWSNENWEKISTKTLNSHKYFKLVTNNEEVMFGERKPKIYYFKFK